MKKLFSIAALLLFIEVCQSQTGSITGKILNRVGNFPAAGAAVILEGTNIGAAADSGGNFKIEKIPEGNYRLIVSSIGYKKKTEQINVIIDKEIFLHFLLDPDFLFLSEVVVEGERSYTASSSLTLRAFDFELRPRQSTQDMLRLAPGLFIAQHAGGGKSEQIFIRNFDADHGTDINISVDGIPVNMVSHGHGQGYADLHFIIPETVQGIEVEKGPYYTMNGNFSTAGSIKFNTLDFLEKSYLKFEGGSFSTARTLAMLQLPFELSRTSSYIAAEFNHTDGYWNSPINFNRYNVFGKLRTELSEVSNLTFSISSFGAAWDAAGQIPERAVNSGLIGRFGSIDESESGTTRRTNLNLSYSANLGNNADINAQFYFTDYRFKLYSNFTFFLNDPVNGDEIEQSDLRSMFGFRGSYGFNKEAGNIKFRTTLGTSFRSDYINVELWNSKDRERLSLKTNARVLEKSAGLFAEEEISLGPMVRLILGLRGDFFIFDVEDKLMDIIHQNISGYKQQTILSPKANLVVSPITNLDLFLNFGQSFHSNDARVVVAEQSEPTLPRATGYEAGTRIKLFNSVFFSAAAWRLDLESEFVYVGDEGVTEASGSTKRVGLDFNLRTQILSWLWADADLNVSEGKFKDLPEGENNIPLAPDLTSTGGLTARFINGLEGSIRYRHIGERPANEDNSVRAKGYTVVDLVLGYNYSWFSLGLSLENLFDVDWNEAQFDTESRLLNEAESVSELHFTPGTPRNIRASVSLNL